MAIGIKFVVKKKKKKKNEESLFDELKGKIEAGALAKALLEHTC